MKEKSDDLERMFREGLQDLKAEPDAAVWLAIQDAMKKRRRFWLFWSITGMVAIGLVTTVLLQNQSMDHGPLTIAQQVEGDEETRRLGDEEMMRAGDEEMEKPEENGQNTEAQERHPEQADESSGEVEPPRHVEGQGLSRNSSAPLTMTEDPNREPGTQNPKPETQNPKPETQNPKPETLNPKPETQNPKPETQNPEPRTLNPAPNALMSLRIPFLYQEQLRDYPLLASTYQPKRTGDSTKKVSPWSLAFNPGVLLPSVQSFGKTGSVNYEKINEFRPGISMSLFLNYSFKQNWIMRTGINWSSYTVSGTQRYFGNTDTVEWIDRERNTGFQTIEKDRKWDFESRYQWIGIPLELGRRQNFNNGFGWEWTVGGGVNYLYRYDKIAENNRYLGGIDEGINRLQFTISAGFGAYYQWKGPWSTFVNVRYHLQPKYLYESDMLREKHQILQFGIGLQYQLKWKGN